VLLPVWRSGGVKSTPDVPAEQRRRGVEEMDHSYALMDLTPTVRSGTCMQIEPIGQEATSWQ
jgi:predicted dithiol-disulfide oxidoreductase (DUF899 family)